MTGEQPEPQESSQTIIPRAGASDAPREPLAAAPEEQAAPSQTAVEQPASAAFEPADTTQDAAAERPRISIGSQRPGSPIVRARPFQSPIAPPRPPRAEPKPPVEPAGEAATARHVEPKPPVASTDAAAAPPPAKEPKSGKPEKKRREFTVPPPPVAKTPVPSIRAELPPELQQEVEEALAGLSMGEVLEPSPTLPMAADLEPESRHQARVVSIHRDDVFVELGGRNQGVLSLRQFAEPPAIGATVEVAVTRFDPEEGLYHVALPHAAVVAANWADIAEGVMVEARVTGHNKGGLECEVNNIRAFIPASHIDIYRVEDFAQFVGQKFPCIVTEARPERGNLVLSRRALIEREKAEAKEKLLAELAEGQVREGIVRSLQNFGAFVDLGGVDGLLHVSQLAWQRVKHPSEVLHLGQTIKVLVRKIDPQTHKISLALRDLTENPWTSVATKYPVTSTIRGTVSKIMEFGAFVQLEPGVEGLVHISELSHQRVWRVSDMLKEGDTVDAKILSVDAEQQRIGLSMKALAARPAPVKKAEAEPEEEEAPPPSTKRKTPLKGGLGSGSGGDRFGLKW